MQDKARDVQVTAPVQCRSKAACNAGGEACTASGWHVVHDISQGLNDIMANTTAAGCKRHYFGGPGDANSKVSVGPAGPLLEVTAKNDIASVQLSALRNKMTGSSTSLLLWPAHLPADGWPPVPATLVNAAMRISNEAMVAA